MSFSYVKVKKLCKYRFLSLLLIPLALIIKWIMSLNPAFTEKYYSRGLYPLIVQPISRFTGLFPFSVAEISIFFLVSYFLCLIISCIIKSISHRNWYFIIIFLSKAALIVSILIFLQTILWGINYERITFADSAGIVVEKYSTDDLEELCRELIIKTNTIRDKVKENENGIMSVDGGFNSLAKRAHLGYEGAQKKYPFIKGKYGKPKPVILSRLMSHSNIIGIYSGITGEANIDIDIPDIELPSTIMHELAHQRGFAHEDEANFIAYISCINHPDADFQYSGLILALQHSMNALYRVDPERYFALIEHYSPKLLNDLRDQQKYWIQFQGVMKKVANSINDTYLKLNGEKDGVQSYGRMVDLLLAEYKNN